MAGESDLQYLLNTHNLTGVAAGTVAVPGIILEQELERYIVTYSHFTSSAEAVATNYYNATDVEALYTVSSQDYNTAIQSAINSILNPISLYSVLFTDVAKIQFQEAEFEQSINEVGIITFGQVEGAFPPFGGQQNLSAGYYRYTPTADYPSERYGDIWINTDNDVTAGRTFLGYNTWERSGDIEPGTAGYKVLLEEIAHSLGIDIYDELGNVRSGNLDNHKYTITSYNIHPDLKYDTSTVLGFPSDIVVNSASGNPYATGLQLYDIAALQAIYGREYNTRADETVYSRGGAFTSNVNDGAFIYTVWDGGGTDSIYAYDFLGSVKIDLRQGEFSSIGNDGGGDNGFAFTVNSKGQFAYAKEIQNVAIAFHTVIENAAGTAESDILIGNAWNNILRGEGGNDHLYGDGVTYDGKAGFGALAEEDDPYRTYGTRDGIHGAADDLSGSDQLYGGDGDDVLYGGRGNDLLDGGNDKDTTNYTKLDAAITVRLGDVITVEKGTSGGTDTLHSIEKIIGNPDFINIVDVSGVLNISYGDGRLEYDGHEIEIDNFRVVSGNSEDQRFRLVEPMGVEIVGGGGYDRVEYASAIIDSRDGLPTKYWSYANDSRFVDSHVEIDAVSILGGMVLPSDQQNMTFGGGLRTIDYSWVQAGLSIEMESTLAIMRADYVNNFFDVSGAASATISFGNGFQHDIGTVAAGSSGYDLGDAIYNLTSSMLPVVIAGSNFGDTVTFDAGPGQNFSYPSGMASFISGYGDDRIDLDANGDGVSGDLVITYRGGHDVISHASSQMQIVLWDQISEDVVSVSSIDGGYMIDMGEYGSIRLEDAQSMPVLSYTDLGGTWGSDRIVDKSGDVFGFGGNDFIVARADNSRVYGGEGDDVLVAGQHLSYLYGADGTDTFIVTGEEKTAQVYDGGNGDDEVVFDRAYASYVIEDHGSGSFSVSSYSLSGAWSDYELASIESLRFTDGVEGKSFLVFT